MANRSLNKVILIGNLTRDPELKYTPNGTAVCTFGVATNRSWKTTDGTVKEEVQYHRIVSWQKLAELCGKILSKGRKVYLEGRLVYRTFTGRDNQQKSITEIVLEDFIVFSDGRKQGLTEETAPTAPGESKTEEQQSEAPVKPNEEMAKGDTQEVSTPEEKKTDENVNPDDIPF